MAPLRQVFRRPLRKPPPSGGESAQEVKRVLQRNQAARSYHWYHKTKTFPPRRELQPTPAGAPKKKRLQ